MMKQKILFLLAVCANFFPSMAQQPFICTEPGTVLEFARYDKKDRLIGYMRSTVESCEKNADGWLEVRTREQELDLERNPISKKEGSGYLHACAVIRTEDMLLPLGDMLTSVLSDKDLSVVRTEGDEYGCPLSLSVGMDLPDVASVYNICSDGEPTKMNLQFSVKDRRVLAQEQVTVPAGTFEAYRIEETVSMKFLFIRVTRKIVTWRVPGIGDIRNEELTEKGKLESRSELLSIRRLAAE